MCVLLDVRPAQRVCPADVSYLRDSTVAFILFDTGPT